MLIMIVQESTSFYFDNIVNCPCLEAFLIYLECSNYLFYILVVLTILPGNRIMPGTRLLYGNEALMVYRYRNINPTVSILHILTTNLSNFKNVPKRQGFYVKRHITLLKPLKTTRRQKRKNKVSKNCSFFAFQFQQTIHLKRDWKF